jgi:hypothetical protein
MKGEGDGDSPGLIGKTVRGGENARTFLEMRIPSRLTEPYLKGTVVVALGRGRLAQGGVSQRSIVVDRGAVRLQGDGHAKGMDGVDVTALPVGTDAAVKMGPEIVGVLVRGLFQFCGGAV